MSYEITLIGLAVGVLVGLTGVGGASLLMPILVLIGIKPSIAVGTDLVYNSITKLFGTVQHVRQKTVDYQLMKYLAIGSIPSAVAATILLQFYQAMYHDQEKLIKQALGYVLLLVAISMILLILFRKDNSANHPQLKTPEEKWKFTVLIGAILGFIVGLTSVGSGSLFAVAMMMFYRISSSKLVGTDIAHAFLLVTVSGLLHAGLGNVDYLLVLNLISGSVPGVLIGSKLSAKVPTKFLRIVISVIIGISGWKLLYP